MRKFLGFFVVLAMLVLGVMPAAAVSTSELTALASSYPAISPFFAATRIDRDFIAELDALAANMDASTGGMLQGANASIVLNQLAQEFDSEGSFETTFAWLGDTAAIGLTRPNAAVIEASESNDSSVVFALALADARGAELFWDNALLQLGYTKIDAKSGSGIVYAPDSPSVTSPTVFIGADVMLFRTSSIDAGSIAPTFDASLADNPDFTAAIGRLPQSDYNAVVYLDPAFLAPVIEEIMQENQMAMSSSSMPMAMNMDMPMNVHFPALLQAIGPQSVGFVILDGRSLVMDVASNIADPDAFMAAGGRVTNIDVVNLGFLNNVPATTALMVHSSNFGVNILEVLAQLHQMGTTASALADSGELSYDMREVASIDEAVTFLRLSFQGLVGMPLEQALGAAAGDYVAYLAFNTTGDQTVPALPDFGTIFEITDQAIADELFAIAPQVAVELGVNTEDEAGVLVVPLLGDALGFDALDMLLSMGDGIVVSGTRPGVSTIASGEFDSIASTDAFIAASAYFLPETELVAYINVAALSEIVTELTPFLGSDAEEINLLLSLLESASLTANYNESGTGLVRGVITLAGQ